MTIQFGLVGSDGVAIVGDTLHYASSAEARTTFRQNPTYNRGTIAVAWSDKGNGLRVSKAITQEMTDG